MADDIYKIRVAVETQAAEVQKINEAVEKMADNMKAEASGVGKVWSGVFLDIGARITDLATKVPSAVASTIQAFGQQEMAVNKLASAIRSQGGSVSEVLPIMQEFASEMQKITTYGDEQVLAMQAMAMATGVNAAQMDECIKGAIGLSNAYGLGLNEAVKASAAVIQGKTEKLNELIPALSQCATAEERAALAQKAMTSGFAQAKAEADGTLGALKQAANAWGDLAEVAGGTFAPVAVDVANALKWICEQLSNNSEIVRVFIGGLSSLAVGLAFSKIGGLANVAKLFSLVSTSMKGATLASNALNASLRANPLGVLATAVSALGLAFSYFGDKAKKAYEQNIEKSREQRDAIDAEIETLKKWGISVEDNKKRATELREEIAKLHAENQKLTPPPSLGAFQKMSEENTAKYQNNIALIKKKEEALKALEPVEKLAELNEKSRAEAVAKANEILEKSNKEIRLATSIKAKLEETTKKLAEAQKELNALESAFKSGNVADTERVAKAQRLAELKREILKLGNLEIEQLFKLKSSNFEQLKTAELQKQQSLEIELNGEITRGNREKAEALRLEISKSQEQQRRLDLNVAFIESRKSEIKTAEDLKRVQAEASRYANAQLDSEKSQTDVQKFLASSAEKSKTTQRDLEFEILQARASGNESLAKETEGKLRIAQLTSEIFENSRKEGMTKPQLIDLQSKAVQQAQERYSLEKQITEESERQNLAKNNAAKIEDILLANKIEQLKAEGKLAEAKELEREREINRTLAGLEGVSDEDKEMLRKTMRQTNDYRDRQNMDRGSYGRSGYGGSSERGGYDSYASSDISRKNSFMSRGGRNVGFGGGSMISSGGSRRASGRKNIAPSRRQGETWEEANERYARTQADKAEARENKARERDMRNSLSSRDRIRYDGMSQSQKKTAMTNFYNNRKNAIRTGANKLIETTKNEAKSMANGGNQPRKTPSTTAKNEDNKPKKTATPARQALNSRITQFPQKTASNGGGQNKIIALLESIDRNTRTAGESRAYRWNGNAYEEV